LVGVAAVQVHLPAAGLLLRELHLDVQPFEQTDDRLPGGREQRVAEAGDEQAYAHRENEFPRSARRAIGEQHPTREGFSVYTQDFNPVSDSLGLSAIFAVLPIITL